MTSRSKKDLPVWAIKFKRFRLSKGLSQKELAELLDIHYMTVASYEQGTRKPKSKTMELMNEQLGLDIYEVFFNEELEDFTCKK